MSNYFNALMAFLLLLHTLSVPAILKAVAGYTFYPLSLLYSLNHGVTFRVASVFIIFLNSKNSRKLLKIVCNTVSNITRIPRNAASRLPVLCNKIKLNF